MLIKSMFFSELPDEYKNKNIDKPKGYGCSNFSPYLEKIGKVIKEQALNNEYGKNPNLQFDVNKIMLSQDNKMIDIVNLTVYGEIFDRQ